MSKYKNKLDAVEWSFSTVHMYEQCPYAFYMKKIENLVGDSNAYAEIGKYGHELNEKIFKRQLTVQQVLEACVENFDDCIMEYISDSSREKKYLAMCDYFSSFDESFWDKFEVIAAEEEFHWKIGKYKCIGYADLILRRKNDLKIFLIDHKSAPHFFKKDGTPLKAQTDNYLAYKNQMYMYADAMKNKYGFYPDYLVWNHFLDNGTITMIPFLEEELQSTLIWFKDIVQRIYKDKTFEAIENFIMCNQLCDYRNGFCEYKDMWREEREAGD